MKLKAVRRERAVEMLTVPAGQPEAERHRRECLAGGCDGHRDLLVLARAPTVLTRMGGRRWLRRGTRRRFGARWWFQGGDLCVHPDGDRVGAGEEISEVERAVRRAEARD